LNTIYKEIREGKLVFDVNCEDVHTNIQNELEKRLDDGAWACAQTTHFIDENHELTCGRVEGHGFDIMCDFLNCLMC
jgi:hypothetical protein